MPGVGQGEVRVELDGLLEHLQRVVHVLAARVAPAAQVAVVGQWVFRGLARDGLFFLRGERDPQGLGDAPGDLLLDGEDVFQLPVVALGPDGMPRRGFHELCGDADAVPRAADGAFEHVGGAELLTHLLRRHRLVAEREHLRAGKDLQLLDLRQLGDDVLGDPVAEVLVLLRAALVLEVEHGDGSVQGRGRLRTGARNALVCLVCGGSSAGVEVALEPLQVGTELGGRLAAQVGILLERLVQDALQRDGQARIELLRRRGRGMQDPVEDERRCRGGKRSHPRRHLVQHDAEREQIRARVELFAPRLLRRHVQDRAHGAARARQVVFLEGVGPRRNGGGAHRFGDAAESQRSLRQTEIQDLRRPAFHEKDVRGLDVAVHDSLRMGRIEAVGDLNADLQELRDFDRFGGDSVLESLALEQFHGDERPTLELSDVVNRADVGIVERRRGARLAAKPLDRLGVLGDVVGKKLERNIPAEPVVSGLVDHAHPTPAQLFQDAVVRNGPTENR